MTDKARVSTVSCDDPLPEHPLSTGRRCYAAPALIRYGDVRGITLGGTPGCGDSGGEFTEDPQFGTGVGCP